MYDRSANAGDEHIALSDMRLDGGISLFFGEALVDLLKGLDMAVGKEN